MADWIIYLIGFVVGASTAMSANYLGYQVGRKVVCGHAHQRNER